jgi:hypothetical protein
LERYGFEEKRLWLERRKSKRAVDASRIGRVWLEEDYEVRYESKKTGKSKRAVKKALKKVGSSRKKVERRLGGG